jgi:hypothetical protein
MSTLLLERSLVLEEGFACDDVRLRRDGVLSAGTTEVHGGLTLDDLITGVWESLAVRGTVACPVCVSSSMAGRTSENGGDGHEGSCLNCGSRLS